ncbi:MAG TPA: hypothetical protein ENK88_03775 [Campylobacterales bacterium]|nr:hypothetical protein [Campylobacterales bacterium]
MPLLIEGNLNYPKISVVGGAIKHIANTLLQKGLENLLPVNKKKQQDKQVDSNELETKKQSQNEQNSNNEISNLINYDKVAINDCGILGCKEYQAQGYGLITKGFINTTDFYSATPFWVHIYRLKPTVVSLDPKIVNINGSKKMTKVAVAKSYQIEPNKIGLKSYPKNFKNFTIEEFAPFRLPLIGYINALSREISTTLLNNP